MKRLILVGVALAVGLAVGWPPTALAAPTAAEKCLAFKTKQTGKYAQCRLKAVVKAAKAGEKPDYTKCDDKITAKFAKADARWGAACPTGTVTNVQDEADTDERALLLVLNGGVPPVCGDGVVEGKEDCELGNLNGGSCQTLGYAGGTLACGTGCTYDTSGCWASRYVDNGDGTVTDNSTGLMWEQKDNAGGIHDVSLTFSWSATGTAPDGTAFTVFLAALDSSGSSDGVALSGCFAGHCDWRLPTIEELQTIVSPFQCYVNACIDPVFGPTAEKDYWSATTDHNDATLAWSISFLDDSMNDSPKTTTSLISARAVRGSIYSIPAP